MLFEFQFKKTEDIKGFFDFMREKHPDIIRRRFCCNSEENTEELRTECWKHGVIVVPMSTFVETTFTAKEMAALKMVVDYAAKHCGGGDDTIGAILYTGAARRLEDNDSAVVNLARKIDCYGD